jgi:hypothetical protein
MKLPSVDSVETLSLGALRRLVAGLVGKTHELEADVATLRNENRACVATMNDLCWIMIVCASITNCFETKLPG